MTFEVEARGRTRTVAVEPVARAEGRFRVTIDGRERMIDAREVDPSTLSLIMLDGGGACHEVGLVEGAVAGELLVRTRDGLLGVTVNGRRLRRGDADGVAGMTGDQRVVAPMPGKIVRVLVAPGAEVKVRQAIVVIEAMKMECELTAPRAGRIKEISVEAGMSVEAGRVLAVVE